MDKYLYNEYYKITQMRLRQYPYQKVAVENLQERIEGMKGKLETVGLSAKTPKYSDEPVSTAGGGSPTESAAERRILIERELDTATKSYQRLTHILKLTDRALTALKNDEKRAVELYYFNGCDLKEMPELMGSSFATCRRRINDGTRHVAFMIFGDVTEEDVFAVK